MLLSFTTSRQPSAINSLIAEYSLLIAGSCLDHCAQGATRCPIAQAVGPAAVQDDGPAGALQGAQTGTDLGNHTPTDHTTGDHRFDLRGTDAVQDGTVRIAYAGHVGQKHGGA